LVPKKIDELKKEGLSDEQILEKISEMHNENLINYGNKSKVGAIFDSQNKKILDFQRKLV
jgi:hypothetical protein